MWRMQGLAALADHMKCEIHKVNFRWNAKQIVIFALYNHTDEKTNNSKEIYYIKYIHITLY